MEKFSTNKFLRHLILDCGLKKEFVDDMKGTDKYEGALFVDYLNKLGKVGNLESQMDEATK